VQKEMREDGANKIALRLIHFKLAAGYYKLSFIQGRNLSSTLYVFDAYVQVKISRQIGLNIFGGWSSSI
jgi:hypothetical protein